MALRFLSGVSALLLLTTCFILVAGLDESTAELTYLQGLVVLYLSLAGMLLLTAEFAPAYIYENYVIRCLPWMGMRYGKGLLMIVSGLFCLDDKTFNQQHNSLQSADIDTIPNTYAGVSLIFTGMLWSAFYYARVEANPSDYRGFQHPQTDLALIMRGQPTLFKKPGHANTINKYKQQAQVFQAEMQNFSRTTTTQQQKGTGASADNNGTTTMSV